MADEENKPAEAGAGGGKKKLLLFGGIGLAVVLVGGGAAFFLLRGGSESHSTAAAGDKAPPAKDIKEGEHGENPAGKDKAEGEEHGKEKPGEGHGTPEPNEGDKNEEPGKEQKSDPKKTTGDEEEEETSEADATITFGETFTFEPFHLNLGNPLENRYVRLEISVEYKGGADQKAELERRKVQLRDAVVATVSKKTREFLLAPDGKEHLRLELLNRLNQYMTRKIEAVYITDILIE